MALISKINPDAATKFPTVEELEVELEALIKANPTQNIVLVKQFLKKNWPLDKAIRLAYPTLSPNDRAWACINAVNA